MGVHSDRVHTILTTSESEQVALSGAALPALMTVVTVAGGVLAMVAAVQLSGRLVL